MRPGNNKKLYITVLKNLTKLKLIIIVLRSNFCLQVCFVIFDASPFQYTFQYIDLA